MSKNLTRKSLAFGALIALGSSVIAGSPALAAGEINLVPSSGTSYNALAGTVYNLKATFAPGSTPSSYAQLKYVVTTGADSAVTYTLGTALVTSASTSVAASTTAVTAATSGASATTVNYIGLAATTTSVTSTVSVTAFVDANNDDALTAGEWNTVRSVTFKKVADVNPVVTITPAAAGDTSAKATVNWGDLNVEQISRTAAFGVATGSTNSSLGLEIKVNNGAYAAATYSEGTFTKTGLTIAAADVVSAQAVYATNTYTATPTNTYSSTALGTAATSTASARSINTVNGLVANVVKGNDATATAATAVAAATAAVVRTNGTFATEVKAYDISAGATTASTVVKSGVAVVASVSGTFATALRPASTGVTEISVTVNGAKYTTNATLAAASVALTTSSTGVASVTVSSTGLAANDIITVSFKGQNITAGISATQTDALYTVTDDRSAAIVATNKNTAATFALSVKDQFGVLSARTNERVLVAATQVGATIANQFVPVSGGKATFSITPGTDITTDITVSVDLQISTTNSSTGVTTWAANGTDIADRTVKIRAAAYSITVDPAVSHVDAVAYNATTNAVQSQTATALADIVVPTGGALATGNTTWARVAFTGSNAGESLSITGKDVILSVDGAAAVANSATVVAQGTVVVVYVASNKAGAKTLTISNGSVSKTVSVTFSAADDNAGSAFSFTGSKTIKAGRTLLVTGTLTDKYGNPVAATHGTNNVKLAVSYEGPGLVVGNLPTSTNASGQFTVRVLLGTYDSGAAVLSAVYDNDTTSTTVAEVTASTTTLIGVSASVSAGSKKANVVVKNAEGLTVKVVSGTKSTTKVATSDNYKVSLSKLTSGSKTVKVYVNDILVASKKVTVRR